MSTSAFKSVNVRRNTVKVEKFNGETFTTRISSNSEAFKYAEQLRNFMPENHVHTFERGDGVKWEKTKEVMLHTPITFNHFQKSGDGWQELSSTTEFVTLSEEDEEYYYNQQNCYVGDFSIQERMPKEIFDLLEKEGGKYEYQSNSDTQTWETEVSEWVRIHNVVVWENHYTEQR